jgi:ribonucleoside-diphosphate reductase alpha chain
MLADDVYEIIQKNADKIQAVLDFSRDFNYDYFGFKTLERAYLTKDGK